MADIIYVNSSERRAHLDVPVSPVNNTVTVTIFENDVELAEVNVVEADAQDVLSFQLPFSLVQSDHEFEVRWVFNYQENGQTYEYDNTTSVCVVTPILPITEIQKIVGDDFTDEQLSDIEKAVRYIIQAHTGQFFGKYVGKKSITGNGEATLRMPMRLISMTSMNNSTYWKDILSVRGNGWFITNKAMGIPNVKSDYHGLHYEPVTGWSGTFDGVINPPGAISNRFLNDVEYVIDGVWGYSRVPAAVEEAAKLLVNDYACGDSIYRDRFITSVTAADWRLEFNSGAYRYTGNVRADQLLADYVLRRGWTVL